MSHHDRERRGCPRALIAGFAVLLAGPCLLWPLVRGMCDTTNYENRTLAAFPDGGEVSEWARGAVAWGVENGVLGNNGEINPTDGCTRAEFVAMVKNVFDPDWAPGGEEGEPGPGPGDSDGIVYEVGVIDLGEYQSASPNGTSATVSNDAAQGVEAGDIVVFDQTLEHPGGVAIKVTSITESGGSATISGTKPALDEVYERYEAHEVAYADPANFVPAPGIKVIDGDPVSTMAEYMGKAIELDLADIDLGEYGSIEGTAALTPGVIFDVKLLSLNPRVELGVIGNAKLSLDVDVSALPGNLRHIKLGSVPILGADGWGANLEFFLNLDLDGSLYVSTGIEWEASISTDDGARAESTPTGTTIDAQIDAEMALEANATFDIMDWSLGNVGIEAGAHGAASVNYRPNSDLVCNDFSSYFLSNFMWDVLEDIDLSFAHLDGELSIFDEDNSPWKVALHFENGKLVSECTWEEPGEPDEPGTGEGTVDPNFDGIPIPEDEGWGTEPIWTTDEDGGAIIAEPFYLKAGTRMVITTREDSEAGAMFWTEGDTLAVRREVFHQDHQDGRTYSSALMNNVASGWSSLNGISTFTIDVLVGQVKVTNLSGSGRSGAPLYTLPVIRFEQIDVPEYPVSISATSVTASMASFSSSYPGLSMSFGQPTMMRLG